LATIVVGIDGSEESKRALRWAVNEAALRRAELKVVYAYDVRLPWSTAVGEFMSMNMSTEEMRRHEESLRRQDDQMREHAQAFVEDLVSQVDVDGVEVRTVVLQDRQPADVLLEQSEGADMLVVGSRGLGGFVGLVVGSVSQQCLHHAKCPVVVVRSGA